MNSNTAIFAEWRIGLHKTIHFAEKELGERSP
jgi:hypothetical protein